MQTITLGGRAFQVLTESTIRFDLHVEATLRANDLHEIEKRNDETPRQFADRLFAEIVATGKALEIVALFLVPVGEEWSVEGCGRMAEFLGSLTAAQDKAIVKDLVIQAFMGFFANGLSSIVISRTSLLAGRTGGQPVHRDD